MSSDRIPHLRRQQALLREHLAWLEAEIARESADSNNPKAEVEAPVIFTEVTPAFPSPVSTFADTAASAGSTTGTPDELLQQYAEQERLRPDRARTGCILAAALFFGLLCAGLTIVYFLRYR